SLFGITTRLNVWTSILVFSVALVAFILLGRKGRPEPDSVYLPGREPAKTVAGNAAGNTGDEVRDPDPVVSDTEARDNLPDNQSGSRPTSAPTEEATAAPAGTKPGTDATASGHSGSTATGTAPEAGTSK
ncbi:MAG TPA: prolipoprotein diacylglyceryl transferase, partial [Arthrobacter sp.]